MLTPPRNPGRLLVPGADRAGAEVPPTLRAVCVRDADPSELLPNLARLLRGLGETSPRAIATLSDTTGPAARRCGRTGRGA